MALKILLAHQDSTWLENAAGSIRQSGYEVATATSGKQAQSLIAGEKFFSVVLSQKLENHSGAQVLKFVKSNTTGVTVIFLSEKETLEQWSKLGAKHTLLENSTVEDVIRAMESGKSINDLMSAIEKREGVSEELEVSEDDAAFTKIPIEEFYSSKAVLFDVFIQLSSEGT